MYFFFTKVVICIILELTDYIAIDRVSRKTESEFMINEFVYNEYHIPSNGFELARSLCVQSLMYRHSTRETSADAIFFVTRFGVNVYFFIVDNMHQY